MKLPMSDAKPASASKGQFPDTRASDPVRTVDVRKRLVGHRIRRIQKLRRVHSLGPCVRHLKCVPLPEALLYARLERVIPRIPNRICIRDVSELRIRTQQIRPGNRAGVLGIGSEEGIRKLSAQKTDDSLVPRRRGAQVLGGCPVDVSVYWQSGTAVADIGGLNHESAFHLLLHAERPPMRIRRFAIPREEGNILPKVCLQAASRRPEAQSTRSETDSPRSP